MTPNINDLLSKLPIEALAARVGAEPEQVRAAAAQVLPSLLMGMGANAQDPAGERSLAQAVENHDPQLADGTINVDEIDTEDGAKIARHVFGSNEDQVAHQLGGMVGGGALVKKLLPLLAPLAMSWLAGQLQNRTGGSSPSSPAQGGVLEQLLGQVLGGVQGQAPTTQSNNPLEGLGGLGDLLGGLLGGGRR